MDAFDEQIKHKTGFNPKRAKRTLARPSNGRLVSESFNQYKKDKKNILSYLRDFQKKESKKIVISIDELDRAKPTYAIQL